MPLVIIFIPEALFAKFDLTRVVSSASKATLRALNSSVSFSM